MSYSYIAVIYILENAHYCIVGVYSGGLERYPTLWPPDGKSRLIGKDPDAGKE